MKKLLLMALLLVALVVTAVACTNNDKPAADTTVAETTGATDPGETTVGGEETTVGSEETAAGDSETTVGSEETTEGDTTEEVTTDNSLKADTPYYIDGYNQNGTIYFTGRITADDGSQTANRLRCTGELDLAKAVYLEAGGAEGEWYIYFMDEENVKTYIWIKGDNSNSMAFATEKTIACLWVIDEEAKTIACKAIPTRGLALMNTSTRDQFGSYATIKIGEPNYSWCWFVSPEEAAERAEEETAPEA